jgi:S-adenosylmethionine:tRNA ribosyltransferase-isomerase
MEEGLGNKDQKKEYPLLVSIYRAVNIDDYDYDLPDERIAKYPLVKRDSSKLLVYKDGQITDAIFNSLPDYIPENSLMIFNNSKVIQARMHFQKSTGAQIEIFCLEPYKPHDYALIFQQTRCCSWVCLIGNLKKWKEGSLYKIININGKDLQIEARRLQSNGDSHVVEFEWDDESVTFADILDAIGELPIPPYLNRKTEEQDKQTYQTVYSKIKGSVAAPTAGLHFTEEVMHSLREKGIELNEVTLHVGAGTFKPVKTNNVDEHVMHSEFISVRKDMILRLLGHKGPVIAVGTTSVRTIESLYYIGELLGKEERPKELKVEQGDPYYYRVEGERVPVEKALQNIVTYLEKNNLNTLIAETQIMIKPGFCYRIIDGMVTNFHQPKSTLLLLVSAFVGNNDAVKPDFEVWKKIYNHALDNGYRFLSYGDSSLLLREDLSIIREKDKEKRKLEEGKRLHINNM